MIKFSFLISTKNRLEDLKITLQKSFPLIFREDVERVIVDDGSNDGTSEYIEKNYPSIKLITNVRSRGYIYNRNFLLNNCQGKYAISLDDDANFITENCLEIIENHFQNKSNCGVIACRIYWNNEKPHSTSTTHSSHNVKGFVGCGHVWNVEAWHIIPNYPEWYSFYGEEDFASLHLFKKGYEIHYVPELLVHHRVNNSERKTGKDYLIRRRHAIRAGWYNYFLFYPSTIWPKKMMLSIWLQLKNHTFKGNSKATIAMIQAFFDLIFNFNLIIKNRNALNNKEFKEFSVLPEAKIYWNPENE